MNAATALAQSPTEVSVGPQLPSSIEELMSIALWGCIVLGVLTIVLGSAYTAWKRSTSYGDSGGMNVAALLCGGLVLAVAPAAIRFVVIGTDTDTTQPAAADTPSSEPLSTPIPAPPAEATPSVPFDWTPLIWLGSAVAAIAVLVLTGYLAVRTRHHVLDRKATAHTLAADFAAAQAIYSQVADAYAEYLTDPYAIFTRAQLDNLDEPRTAAFITAFNDAGALNTETCSISPERVCAFGDAAQTALTAWNTADQYARAIGMGVQTDDTKRTVRRIRSALELALDDTAAAGERETAMATVQRLSGGLMTVPERVYARAKTAIESVTRKQLTS